MNFVIENRRIYFKSRKKQSQVLFILGYCSWKRCKESFLFSLLNPSGTGPTLLPLKGTKNQNGIFYKSSYGPTFGAGYDLFIASGANANSESYSNLGQSMMVHLMQTVKHSLLAK